MALEGDMKTPIGPVKKKTAAIVGAGGILIIGIVWYRTKQQNAAAATTATDQSGNIDPATGLPTGSPEDLAALQAQNQGQFDSSSFTGGQVTGYTSSGQPVYSPGAGAFGSVPPNTGPGTFTSNGQWSQYAEQYLVDNAGGDAATVGNALGKYITGQPVTPDQTQIIDSAIAFAGYPPIAGPAGNPPGINTINPPVPPGGTGGGTGTPHWVWFTVPVAGLTLEGLAKRNHWTAATLAGAESLNHLAGNSRLNKGQKIKKPVR
jgi:hypothetical protein